MNRGDLLVDDMRLVAQAIKDADPGGHCLILATAGPPCPDFSPVMGKNRGRDQPEGSKFIKFCQKLCQLEELLPHHTFAIVVENVVMSDESDCLHFSKALRAQPVLLDSADLGAVSRPRLWWTRLDWSKIRTNPFTGEQLVWTQHNQHRQIRLGLPKQNLQELITRGFSLHPDVLEGTRKVPCFTTPSPDEGGRPPPAKHRQKLDDESRQRWLSDNRQFAPWQYTPIAMAKLGDQLEVMPPHLKEQLHQYPVDYTLEDGVTPRARHRLLANSWHIKVAAFIIALVLQGSRADAMSLNLPSQVRTSAIQTMLDITVIQMAQPGPGAWRESQHALEPTSDMWRHWSLSWKAGHPAQAAGQLEPGLRCTVEFQMSQHKYLADLRGRVLAEIHDLVEEWQDTTQSWFQQLDPSIQQVYTANGTKQVTQVPLFMHLLDLCGHGGVGDLRAELTSGFPLIGSLRQGTGWLPRLDERYSTPISLGEFHARNIEYVRLKLNSRHPSRFWKVMLDELLTDKEKGRVQGPFQAPDDWHVKTVGVSGHPCLPLPTEHAYAAVCFAVEQQDKIRRCEDFRRSWHNATVHTHDVPHHHDIHTYVELMKEFTQHGAHGLSLWSQDLDAAYRQLPISVDSYSYTILHTPAGPTLWRHAAAPFGAAASVWAFNRFADSMVSVSRRLLGIAVGHFVDDFTCIDPADLSDSSFKSFRDLYALLGLNMKPSKEQPPNPRQRVLGVFVSVSDHQITLEACPERKDKVLRIIQDVLDDDRLPSPLAQQLAGKLGFLSTTLFGSVGRTALAPIYARGHGVGEMVGDRLTTGLRQSLFLLQHVLHHAKPRIIPLHHSVSGQVAVVYTDAYFKPGEAAGSTQEQALLSSNGWGFVVRTNYGVAYSHGVVPASFVERFTTNKAFIYLLEILAVLVVVIRLQDVLPRFLIFYVDNMSGRCALEKG